MELKEIKKLKEALEHEIYKAVTKFSDATDLFVEEIDLQDLTGRGSKYKAYAVKCKVSL